MRGAAIDRYVANDGVRQLISLTHLHLPAEYGPLRSNSKFTACRSLPLSNRNQKRQGLFEPMLRKLKQMFWGRPVEAEQPKLAAIASIAPWEHPASYRCANCELAGVHRQAYAFTANERRPLCLECDWRSLQHDCARSSAPTKTLSSVSVAPATATVAAGIVNACHSRKTQLGNKGLWLQQNYKGDMGSNL